MLSRFRPQAGRAWRIALVLGMLSAVAAAQNTCPPGIYPCVGQGPFRLFIGPLNDTVPAGAQDFFWAVRDANQDLNGTNFLDISTQGSWSSSDQTVATIDNSGAATTYKQGSTLITFRSGPFTSSTILNVGPAVVSFITVTPKNPTVALPAGTQSFTAVATYTDGTAVDITTDPDTSWTTDDPTIVTISGHTATAAAAGSTYVNATFQSVTGFTGINSGMTCLTLSPTNPTAVAGSSVGFFAYGYFGTTPGDCSTNQTDVSPFVNWSSSNTTVADVDRIGIADALSAGNATITAASSPLTVSTNMQVTPPTLDSIEIRPTSDVTVDQGRVQAYTAIGTYSDKSTQDLTNSVTWLSSDQTVAAISNVPPSSGVAQALNKVGSTQISLTFGTTCTDLCLPDPVNLNVVAPVLESITVTPANPSMAKGKQEQFTATGNYSSGPPQDLTGAVTWSSSDISVASINASGLATSLPTGATGTTTITATLGQLSGTTVLTVTPAQLQSITISPATPPTIKTGQTQQFTATGRYSDNTTSDITNAVTWHSGDTTVASINSSGLATAVATNAGSTSIQATSPFVPPSNTATLSVAVLQILAVTPGAQTLTVGGTQQFTATGTYTDSSQIDLTAAVTWSSDHTSVAAICDVNSSCQNKGQAQALAAGSAGVTATQGSVSSSPATLTVNTNSATLQSITIAPLHSFVVVSQTRQYTATGHFSDGSTRNLTTLVNWSSSKTSTASITSAGLVTGVAAGTCTITATINLDGAHSASTDVTVTLF